MELGYSGAVDGAGLPHGRGTLCFPDGSRYEGRFDHGVRQGRGKLIEPDGSYQVGHWEDDELWGPGSLVDADGNELRGMMHDGEIEGDATEHCPRGAITFQGSFRRGRRDGVGVSLVGCDSGVLVGDWTRGLLGGPSIYTFPNDQGKLMGLWQDGEMSAAMYVPRDREAWLAREAAWHREVGPSSQETHAALGVRGEEAKVYRHDPSTATRISSQPLLRDPYEVDTCTVGPSREDGAGEGLFAVRAIGPGELCAAYNGIRLTHAEVDARDWALNENTCSLDDDVVLDVPPELASTQVYCASLGHKANHAHDNNAEYAPFIHPRFGFIKSVRAISPIAAGEEITVDYGYDLEGEDGVPGWYRAYCGRHGGGGKKARR